MTAATKSRLQSEHLSWKSENAAQIIWNKELKLKIAINNVQRRLAKMRQINLNYVVRLNVKKLKNEIFSSLPIVGVTVSTHAHAKVSYKYTIIFIKLFLPDSIVDIGIIRDRSAKVCNAFKAGVSSVG